MPKYTFECEQCSVEFERTLKMAENLTHLCPSCGNDAHRVWSADTLSAFSFKSQQTGATANTGVHADDYPTADKVVGRDADARWAEIAERDKVKAEARRQGGTRSLIRHNNRDYIDYEPMTPVGQGARRKLTHTVLDTMRAQRIQGRQKSRSG